MSGIYIHIPFCKQACHYCDFHFSTSLKNKGAYLSALKKEISMRKNYLSDLHSEKRPKVMSVYLGGGTPSLLSEKEIMEIFGHLHHSFCIDSDAEITIEANPDDLSTEKIKEIKNTPVNRLSIGIQSFADDHLRFLNRTHNSGESLECVKNSQDAGFTNISIDLIYGIPGLSDEQWIKNLETAFGLDVPHISAYCLSIEPGTAFASFVAKGKFQKMDDEKTARQFDLLVCEMEKKNFLHYETSNFCKSETRISLHNSSYWKGAHYLGLGPSAHSFDGFSRQWNVANNNIYIRAIEAGQPVFEKEVLSENDKFNEYVLTSLRTMWGCNLSEIKEKFGEKKYAFFIKKIQPYLSQHFIDKTKDTITLSKSGQFISDKIIRDLFM